jgi:peptidoglycan/LPS O-acetylase OafA/YrhL
MVMWFHYFQNPLHLLDGGFYRAIHRFNTIGQTGVDLFFVLSGFLITRILISTKTQPRYFTNFYVRRFLRILPLYYLFLVIFLFVEPLLLGKALPALSEHWWWWVFLQNIPQTFGWHAYGPNHYWSLAVEEHFYLLWPLLVFSLDRRWLVRACFGLVALSFVTRIALLEAGIDGFYFTPTRLDALSLGSLLALWEPSIVARPAVHLKRFAGAVAVVGIPLFIGYSVMSGSHAAWLQAIKYPLVGAFYFVLLGLAITADVRSVFSRILASALMRFVGSISYGLYVYHSICYDLLDRLVPNASPLFFLPFAFGSVMGVAWLSFEFVEKPILRLKNKYQSQSSRGLAGAF